VHKERQSAGDRPVYEIELRPEDGLYPLPYEETIYWFNLLLDTPLPICGNAAQRPHGMISNDGPKNIVDSVDYIASRVWEDEQGRNRAGAVLIQEQWVFAACGPESGCATRRLCRDRRARWHPRRSRPRWGAAASLSADRAAHLAVRRECHPTVVAGQRGTPGGSCIETVLVPIKGADGRLLDAAIPKVAITKDASYWDDDTPSDPEAEVDLIAMIGYMLKSAPLAGFVVEGFTPDGGSASIARLRLMLRAVHSGLPSSALVEAIPRDLFRWTTRTSSAAQT
jgi:L-asparaginase